MLWKLDASAVVVIILASTAIGVNGTTSTCIKGETPNLVYHLWDANEDKAIMELPSVIELCNLGSAGLSIEVRATNCNLQAAKFKLFDETTIVLSKKRQTTAPLMLGGDTIVNDPSTGMTKDDVFPVDVLRMPGKYRLDVKPRPGKKTRTIFEVRDCNSGMIELVHKSSYSSPGTPVKIIDGELDLCQFVAPIDNLMVTPVYTTASLKSSDVVRMTHYVDDEVIRTESITATSEDPTMYDFYPIGLNRSGPRELFVSVVDGGQHKIVVQPSNDSPTSSEVQLTYKVAPCPNFETTVELVNWVTGEIVNIVDDELDMCQFAESTLDPTQIYLRYTAPQLKPHEEVRFTHYIGYSNVMYDAVSGTSIVGDVDEFGAIYIFTLETPITTETSLLVEDFHQITIGMPYGSFLDGESITYTVKRCGTYDPTFSPTAQQNAAVELVFHRFNLGLTVEEAIIDGKLDLCIIVEANEGSAPEAMGIFVTAPRSLEVRFIHFKNDVLSSYSRVDPVEEYLISEGGFSMGGVPDYGEIALLPELVHPGQHKIVIEAPPYETVEFVYDVVACPGYPLTQAPTQEPTQAPTRVGCEIFVEPQRRTTATHGITSWIWADGATLETNAQTFCNGEGWDDIRDGDDDGYHIVDGSVILENNPNYYFGDDHEGIAKFLDFDLATGGWVARPVDDETSSSVGGVFSSITCCAEGVLQESPPIVGFFSEQSGKSYDINDIISFGVLDLCFFDSYPWNEMNVDDGVALTIIAPEADNVNVTLRIGIDRIIDHRTLTRDNPDLVPSGAFSLGGVLGYRDFGKVPELFIPGNHDLRIDASPHKRVFLSYYVFPCIPAGTDCARFDTPRRTDYIFQETNVIGAFSGNAEQFCAEEGYDYVGKFEVVGGFLYDPDGILDGVWEFMQWRESVSNWKGSPTSFERDVFASITCCNE